MVIPSTITHIGFVIENTMSILSGVQFEIYVSVRSILRLLLWRYSLSFWGWYLGTTFFSPFDNKLLNLNGVLKSILVFIFPMDGLIPQLSNEPNTLVVETLAGVQLKLLASTFSECRLW